TVVSGEEMFKLHDTYGVYSDIAEQMAQEQRLTVDTEGFDHHMKLAKEKARGHAYASIPAVIIGSMPPTDDHPKYAGLTTDGRITHFFRGDTVLRDIDSIDEASGELSVVLDRTNFYTEQG